MTTYTKRHDIDGFGSLKTLSFDAEHSLYLLEDSGVAGSLPVYVQCYFSTTNFYGFTDFLKKFDEKLALEVENCGKSWIKYYCYGGGGHLLLRRKLCRRRNYCPNDAEAYVRLRVNRAWKVIKEFADSVKFGVYVIHLVFTFPKEIWQKGVENPSLLAKCVYETFKQYKSGMFGGVLGIHLWHSDKPQSGWYPHVHVLLLNAVLNRLPQLSGDGIKLSKKKEGCSFYFQRKRPYFNNKLLKIRFKWAIKQVFGYEWVGLPNVYCQYYKVNDGNEGRIKHKLRYIFRLPIQDFANVDFNKLNDVEAKFVWDLFNFRLKRIRWFGFLADGVKKRYLAIAGVKFERLECLLMLLKRESSICPIHGIKMIRLGDYGAG